MLTKPDFYHTQRHEFPSPLPEVQPPASLAFLYDRYETLLGFGETQCFFFIFGQGERKFKFHLELFPLVLCVGSQSRKTNPAQPKPHKQLFKQWLCWSWLPWETSQKQSLVTRTPLVNTAATERKEKQHRPQLHLMWGAGKHTAKLFMGGIQNSYAITEGIAGTEHKTLKSAIASQLQYMHNIHSSYLLHTCTSSYCLCVTHGSSSCAKPELCWVPPFRRLWAHHRLYFPGVLSCQATSELSKEESRFSRCTSHKELVGKVGKLDWFHGWHVTVCAALQPEQLPAVT